MSQVRCRFCGTPLHQTVVDLGMSPLANSYVPSQSRMFGETFFPLHAFVCSECFLVQLEEFESPAKIFSDYSYFSSFSTSWLAHASRYVDTMIDRFGLTAATKVVELASNDGYLLKYFVRRGMKVLGVEPAKNVAAVAIEAGVPTDVAFFGVATARRLVASGHEADVVVANNVLAHVPHILDFVEGIALLLKDEGVGTFEFPHILNMLSKCQFDTIYHEHFSYLSLRFVARLLDRFGLRVFDVEELATHGGSLRVFFCRRDASQPGSANVRRVIAAEDERGLTSLQAYEDFSRQVLRIKLSSLEFLIAAKEKHLKVSGYGAAAKGNTFLNYCKIGPDLVSVVADLSIHKQGNLLPGTRIPIVSPGDMLSERPDYIVIFPWNLAEEITQQLSVARSWDCKFVTFIPEVSVR